MRLLSVTALASALAGCSILPEPPPPVRYVVLVAAEELPDAPPAAPSGRDLTVGLGPITLPEYLVGSQLVVREGTRLVPSDTERWGEPLERAVARVLAADLAHTLGTARPVMHPWFATERPDVQVEIAIARFERDGEGNVLMDARWSVRPLDGTAPAAADGRSTFEQRAESDGAATALALSRALADLALEIARALPGD